MASFGKGKRNYRRERKGGFNDRKDKQKEDVDESSPIIIQFREFQKELDCRHDKHERLVKLSRDITIESKRVIFQLHRSSGSGGSEKILTEAAEKLQELREAKWKDVAIELENEDPYRFLRAYTGGLQEYIEAASFLYYLKNNALISIKQIQTDLVFQVPDQQDVPDTVNPDQVPGSGPPSQTPAEPLPPEVSEPLPPEGSVLASPNLSDLSTRAVTVHVPPVDYMLGIADLTGELMRLAIHSVGCGDLELPFELCRFMRLIHEALASYENVSREMRKKESVLKQSLQKVETACYTLQIRGSEIPKHMLADVLSSIQTSSVSGYDDDGGPDIDS